MTAAFFRRIARAAIALLRRRRSLGLPVDEQLVGLRYALAMRRQCAALAALERARALER